MTPDPRNPEQRKADSLNLLEQEVDAWVATADQANGTPYLVPLSFLWEDSTLLIATPAASPTSRNLQATGKVRLGIGPTRDLVLIEGSVQTLSASDVSAELGDAFATKTGFDPRQLSSPYRYFRIQPERLQTWRNPNKLEARELLG